MVSIISSAGLSNSSFHTIQSDETLKNFWQYAVLCLKNHWIREVILISSDLYTEGMLPLEMLK